MTLKSRYLLCNFKRIIIRRFKFKYSVFNSFYGFQILEHDFDQQKCISFQTLSRYRVMPDSKKKGLFGAKPLVVFTSDESHYSILKGANWYLICFKFIQIHFRLESFQINCIGAIKSRST